MTRKPRRFDWLLDAIHAERCRRWLAEPSCPSIRRALTEQAMSARARPVYTYTTDTTDKEPRS